MTWMGRVLSIAAVVQHWEATRSP